MGQLRQDPSTSRVERRRCAPLREPISGNRLLSPTPIPGDMHITRLKNGKLSVRPRALRRLRREHPEGRYVFQSEHKASVTPAGFRKTLAPIGEASPAGIPDPPAYAAVRLRLQARQ